MARTRHRFVERRPCARAQSYLRKGASLLFLKREAEAVACYDAGLEKLPVRARPCVWCCHSTTRLRFAAKLRARVSPAARPTARAHVAARRAPGQDNADLAAAKAKAEAAVPQKNPIADMFNSAPQPPRHTHTGRGVRLARRRPRGGRGGVHRGGSA